ncbi:nitroreductase family protein [Mariniplasma anaerobium]|uniref:Nitroreductase n=1 Tax=Mariniplasma anaerobium TaxID=2735436 RepID=A0A7U9TGS0_9MOLU|nr:nitroreductase family protein [Mariniplasma anaerobium]BCR35880.1 nitroreductase [Mariniplasma anaerobium]
MLNLIKERKSVRTYLDKDLTEKDLKTVEKIIETYNNAEGFFKHKVKLQFFKKPFLNDSKKTKIGTYGFVTNPRCFIAGCVDNSFYGMVDYGFIFENMILELSKNHLSTVWLGGTFERKTFDFMQKDHEIVPTITPVGYEDKVQSQKEQDVREHVHADQRVPFETLFFNESFDQPLSESHKLAELFELVRFAPSADNKQPWRVLVKKNNVHFYLHRTAAYQQQLEFDVQAIDMGIALSHFVKGLEDKKIKFEVTNDFVNIDLPHLEYAFSVKLNN